MSDGFDEEQQEEHYVSKSQRKRDMLALQELGEHLVKLKPEQLAKVPLPEDLEQAILEAQRIKSRSAHKRQLQFIGRIMRDIDAEPIQQAMETLEARSAQAAARLHLLEQWRERLIEEGDAALGELLAEHPHADRQHLRQLIRKAKKEHTQSGPHTHARALFRYLREMFDESMET